MVSPLLGPLPTRSSQGEDGELDAALANTAGNISLLAWIQRWPIVRGMKADEIRKLLHDRPFRPFIIHVADGGRLLVKHQDYVALAPQRA